MNTEEVKEQQQEIKQIACPAQKTFSYYTLLNSGKKIDREINAWLRHQVLERRQPMLVKLESGSGIFGKKLIFVYMTSVTISVPKTEK